MTNWDILSISPTTNKEDIKKAYMTMLPRHNPEDDPEGFLRLRTAYEEILKELENPTTDTPYTQFMSQVSEVYSNFKNRCDLSVWKALLENEVCQRLDMVDEAEQELLTFFMDRFFMPRHVWAALSAHFDWAAREADLKQSFPAPFIDYILAKSVGSENPRYDLFVAVSQQDTTQKEAHEIETHHYDAWINIFLEIDRLVNAGQTEDPDLKEKQAQLEAIPLTHPYYNILQMRIHMHKGNFDDAMDVIQSPFQQHPDDFHIWFSYATALTFVGKEEESITHFEKILQQDPSFIDAKKAILNAQLNLEDYEAANITVKQILEAWPDDYYALSAVAPITDELIEIYEKKHNAAPTDADVMLTLAEYYAKNLKLEHCEKMLSKLDNTIEAHTIRYKELRAACAVIAGNHLESIALYDELIGIEPKLVYYDNAAAALCQLEQYDKALEYVEEALKLPDAETDNIGRINLCIYKCRALFATGRAEEAMAEADAGLALNTRNVHLYMQKANLCWLAGQYNETMDYCEKAIAIYPYITQPYILQMEIYQRENMLDHVLAIAKQAEDIGYESARISCHKAEALRMLGQYDQALATLTPLLTAENDEGYMDSIFTEMAKLKEETGDLEDASSYISKALSLGGEDDPNRQSIQANILRKQGRHEAAMQICDSILASLPQNVSALVCKGSIYADQDDISTAITHLEAAISANPHLEATYDRIVDILMEASRNEDALAWAQTRLARFESLSNRIYEAIIHVRVGQKDQAETAYKRAIELYPDASVGYRYYGLFLQSCKRFKDAIWQFSIAKEKDPTQLDIYESMAYCYQEEKDYDKALAILNEAETTHAARPLDTPHAAQASDAPQADDVIQPHDTTQDTAQAPYNLGALAMRRGVIYEDMQRYNEALEQMQKAASHPDKLDGEWEMSWIYTRIGLVYSKNFNDASKAMEYFQKAIDEDENCIDAVDYMGDIYLYAHKNYEKAIECYTRKIEKEPDDPHTYATRALAYKKQKRHIRARQDYKKALALYQKKSKEDPSPCWDVYIANCKLGLKEIATAKEMFEDSLDTPQKPGAWCNKAVCDVCLYSLGKICESEKKYDHALVYYNRAIEISNSIKHNAARDELLALSGDH